MLWWLSGSANPVLDGLDGAADDALAPGQAMVAVPGPTLKQAPNVLVAVLVLTLGLFAVGQGDE